MHTKMLELAEKIEARSAEYMKHATGSYNPVEVVAENAVSCTMKDLASDIRTTFAPRDWREGCVVVQRDNRYWDILSPCKTHYLGVKWFPNSAACSDCGTYGTESSARAALASCTTPYPGYKENTCDTPSASSGVSPSIAAPTSTPAPSFPVAVVKGGASVAGGSSNTLTFGGPALRVAFHFDGDRLVRWEILDQREELRASDIPFTHSTSIRSVYSPELNSEFLFIRGDVTKNDGNHPINDEPYHTRATITTLGAEIDQVNREWCEKLGIGEKADESELYSPPGQPDGYARAWFGVCSVANEIDSRWTNLAPTGMEAMCTMIRNLSRDRDSLRRQLDAAEKVIDTYAGLSSAARAYRTTYPKTGGAQ